MKTHASREAYLTSPHLICVEATRLQLTFLHYGNPVVHNSFDPPSTLAILRKLKAPRTLSEILGREARGKSRVREELDRLVAGGFVHRFESGAQARQFVRNPVLASFLKDRRSLAALSKQIAETRVGIVDLGNVGAELSRSLRSAGFRKLTVSPMKAGKLPARFIENSDFIIVIGDVSQKLVFSKLNQLLHRHQKRWLLLTLDAFGGTVGPTFGSGGPCYDCLIDLSARHRDGVFRDSNYLDLIESHGTPVLDFSDRWMAGGVYYFTAIETIKVIANVARPMTPEGFFHFDLLNFRMDYQVAYPSPLCPTCASGEEEESAT